MTPTPSPAPHLHARPGDAKRVLAEGPHWARTTALFSWQLRGRADGGVGIAEGGRGASEPLDGPVALASSQTLPGDEPQAPAGRPAARGRVGNEALGGGPAGSSSRATRAQLLQADGEERGQEQ